MIINGKDINIDDMFDDKYMHKRINDNIYLNDYQMAILDYYKIKYNECGTMKDLIFLINEVLEEDEDLEDLEIVAKEISEFDYYHNTNK